MEEVGKDCNSSLRQELKKKEANAILQVPILCGEIRAIHNLITEHYIYWPITKHHKQFSNVTIASQFPPLTALVQAAGQRPSMV